jgi:hypothetical protein
MACINCGDVHTQYVTCGTCQGKMGHDFTQRFEDCEWMDIDNIFWFMDAMLCKYVRGTNVAACEEQWKDRRRTA